MEYIIWLRETHSDNLEHDKLLFRTKTWIKFLNILNPYLAGPYIIIGGQNSDTVYPNDFVEVTIQKKKVEKSTVLTQASFQPNKEAYGKMLIQLEKLIRDYEPEFTSLHFDNLIKTIKEN